MSTFRLPAVILLFLSSPLSAADLQPAAGPTTRAGTAFWLGHALDEARAIEDPLLQAQAYSTAAVLMARAGDVPGYRRTIGLAEQALGRAPTKPADSPVEDAVERAADSVLRALARAGDVAGAKELAEERSKASKHFRPGHYASIAAGQVEAGDVDGALATAGTFDEYERRTVLKGIAYALIAKPDFARAERVAGMMGPTDSERTDALRAIAAGRARAGEYDAALAMAEHVPYSHDKQAVYQYVVEAQAEAGDYAAARATAARVPLGEGRASSRPPPEYGRTLGYTEVARRQLKRKDIAGAKETAALFEGQLKPHLLRDIAMAELEAGDLTAARQTAAAIPPGGDGVGDTSPRDDAHEALALALARTGDLAEAEQVARGLRRPAETLLRVAGIAVARGEHERARELVRELKEKVESGELWFDFGGEGMPLRIAQLEKALGDPGPFDAAVADLERQAADPGDPEARRTAAMQLFGLYVATGDIDGARRVAPMVHQGALSWVIAAVATSAAQSGNLDRAKALADLMPTPADRAAMHQAILANSSKPPTTDAEAVDQISRLPSAYDRSLAHLARAEAAWSESQRPARVPATGDDESVTP